MKPLLLQKVPMSDGVHLATDVSLPDGSGPFPVLLTRICYRRTDALALTGALIGGVNLPKIYTDWGYAYVVQDARGKYDSEGEFYPFMNEAQDGQGYS